MHLNILELRSLVVELVGVMIVGRSGFGVLKHPEVEDVIRGVHGVENFVEGELDSRPSDAETFMERGRSGMETLTVAHASRQSRTGIEQRSGPEAAREERGEM